MQSENAQATWFYDGLGWLEAHRKQAIQVTAAVAVLAMLISYYFYSRNQKEDAEAAAFSELLLNRATPEDYLKFQQDNHSSQAAPKALLMAGQEYFAMGKFAEAQAQFQKLRQEYRNSVLVNEASLGVAASLDAQGKVDEAIAAYTDLSHQSGDVASLQAQYALGRLYETKGQLDKALENLDAVAQATSSSTMGQEAYVRAGEIRAAHPNLVKAAPAVPPMTPGQ